MTLFLEKIFRPSKLFATGYLTAIMKQRLIVNFALVVNYALVIKVFGFRSPGFGPSAIHPTSQTYQMICVT